jgi:hypothetical protein
MPVAAAENVAVWPAMRDSFCGCDVRDGGNAANTVSVAALLVVLLIAFPAAMETTTSKVEPLSLALVAEVV